VWTGFELTGKHSGVACEKCHAEKFINDAVVRKKMTDAPHGTYLGLDHACRSCHQDVHNGKFKEECGSCHSPAGWTKVNKFDHSKTKFPLEGKHAQVGCVKCHPSFDDQRKKGEEKFHTAGFADCTPCHNSPHKFQLQGRDCKSCHKPTAWRSALSVSFDHNLTSYKLTGRHRSLRCEQCHRVTETSEFKKWFFISFKQCTDCHADKHDGEFIDRYQNDCAVCHTESSFKPSMFTTERHNQGKFSLTGAHRAIVCAACHVNETTGKNRFRFSSIRCSVCHADVHNGQFASIMKDGSCEKCHTTERWNLAVYDHSLTGFALTGTHRSISCAGCHKNVQGGGTAVQFQKLPAECETCHPDKHAGQFAAEGKTSCNVCHVPKGWKDLIFNHESQSSFALQGAHKKVLCGQCHYTETIAGMMIVRYKPLKQRCESCHQKKEDG